MPASYDEGDFNGNSYCDFGDVLELSASATLEEKQSLNPLNEMLDCLSSKLVLIAAGVSPVLPTSQRQTLVA